VEEACQSPRRVRKCNATADAGGVLVFIIWGSIYSVLEFVVLL